MPNKIRRFATRTLPRPIKLTFGDEQGERVTEEFTLVYASYSNKSIHEIEEVENAGSAENKVTVPFSTLLAYNVRSITDKDSQPLTDDAGEVVVFYDGADEEKLKSARRFFDSAGIDDVTKPLWEAIEVDINPPKASPEPGPSGSAATASEA